MYALLTALPWVGRELYEKKENDLERIMAATEGYLRRRNTAHVAALRAWNCDTPHPQEEYLECLWAQVRKLRADEWQERHIYRPYLAFDSILSEALQHDLPTILPPPHTPNAQYPLPWVVFRMFDYTDCPEVFYSLFLLFDFKIDNFNCNFRLDQSFLELILLNVI